MPAAPAAPPYPPVDGPEPGQHHDRPGRDHEQQLPPRRAVRAQPMARVSQSKVKEALVGAIVFGKLAEGGTVVVDAAENELTLS